MKLIILLHCSMLKLANAPSLRLYTIFLQFFFGRWESNFGKISKTLNRYIRTISFKQKYDIVKLFYKYFGILPLQQNIELQLGISIHAGTKFTQPHSHNPIAATDMKLIIVLHCSMLKLADAPSLRLYAHACDLIHEKSTVRTNHRLIAWLHQFIQYLQGISKYIVLSPASPNSKSGKTPLSLSIWNIFTGLSFSWCLNLTMPSLEKQLITW